MGLLKLAYAANIVILLPVVWPMLAGGSVFEGKVAPSPGLAQLVGAFWLAILLVSVAGLFRPAELFAVLVVQVVYKTAWLAVFAIPLYLRDGAGAVPWGVTGSFVAVVLTYPWLIVLAFRG